MPLSHTDRDRLAKLLAMFSSDYPGEIVNAARAAERLVKERGETWEGVIVACAGAPPPPRDARPHREPPRNGPKPKGGRTRGPETDAALADIAACLAKGDLLSAWERNFLESISGSVGEWGSLTERQTEILERIKAKLGKFEDMTW